MQRDSRRKPVRGKTTVETGPEIQPHGAERRETQGDLKRTFRTNCNHVLK